MVSLAKSAEMSWRSRPRMGMMRGGMGGLRRGPGWVVSYHAGCPAPLSCSRSDKLFSARKLPLTSWHSAMSPFLPPCDGSLVLDTLQDDQGHARFRVEILGPDSTFLRCRGTCRANG